MSTPSTATTTALAVEEKRPTKSTESTEQTSISHLLPYLKTPTIDDASSSRTTQVVTQITKVEILRHVSKVTKHWLPRWRRQMLKFLEGITVKYDWQVLLPTKFLSYSEGRIDKSGSLRLTTTISHKHFADIFNFFVVTDQTNTSERYQSIYNPIMETAAYLDKFQRARHRLGFSHAAKQTALAAAVGKRKLTKMNTACSKMIPKNLWYSVITDIYKLLNSEMSHEMLRLIENDIQCYQPAIIQASFEYGKAYLRMTYSDNHDENQISEAEDGNWIYCPRQHYNAELDTKPSQTVLVRTNPKASWYPHRMDKSKKESGYIENLILHGKLTWYDYQIGGLGRFYNQQVKRIIDLQFRFCREKIEPAYQFFAEYRSFAGHQRIKEIFLPILLGKVENLGLSKEDCQDLEQWVQLLVSKGADGGWKTTTTTTTTLSDEDDISDISNVRKIRGALARSVFVSIPLAYEDLLKQVDCCCRELDMPRALSDIVGHYLPVDSNFDKIK